jgi:hypothetical protein
MFRMFGMFKMIRRGVIQNRFPSRWVSPSSIDASPLPPELRSRQASCHFNLKASFGGKVNRPGLAEVVNFQRGLG